MANPSRPETPSHSLRSRISWISTAISILALVISGLVAYKTTLKPFSLRVWMSPVVQIQHKENFGLYVDLAFQNQSPTGGLITDLVLVINRQETPEDKYLLQSIGFRTIDQQGVYRYSEEQMPIFLRPTQWEARTVNFLYVNPEQFPISTGTYVAEVLIWVDYQYKARYCATCRFEISADMLNIYLDRRERGSTFLQPITVVGADVQRSKKITDQEYSGLKQ